MNHAYGPDGDVIDFMGLQLNAVDVDRLRVIRSPNTDPVLKNAWENYNRTSYSTNAYSKASLVLETLRRHLPPQTMENILREYVRRWRFKHPKTQDFIDVVNDVSGENFGWYFDQALRANTVLDYAVASLTSTPIEERGYGFGSTFDDSNQETQYLSEVRIRRLGEFTFPVELEVVFEDGETIREAWEGREAWKRFRFVRGAKLASAAVDPEHKIPLDVNTTNNSRTLDEGHVGIKRTSLRLLFLWQFVLDLLSL
jgi:hypothetical protein